MDFPDRRALGRALTGVAVAFVVVSFLLVLLPVGQSETAGSAGAAATAHPAGAPPRAVARGGASALSARPASVSNTTIGPVYNFTNLSEVAPASQPCWYTNYSFASYQYCYSEEQSPTILHLANNHLGIGDSVYTNIGPLCNATNGTVLSSWTTSNIAWQQTSANVTGWSAPSVIGNVSCQYPTTAEPTFATGTAGNVYGGFVASNQTVNWSATTYGQQPYFPPDWNDAANATLGFVQSANNGTTWSAAKLVPGVLGVARPQMAVFGQTIYIVYIHVPQNVSGVSVYPLGQYTAQYTPALSVQVVASTNGGSTWTTPVTLPGLNASMGNWSTSPSIAVNASGTIAVAYATNRSCVLYCTYGYGSYYGDEIVVAKSTSNGSSWSAPTEAATTVGESLYYQFYGDYYYYEFEHPWEATPQTSIAFGANASAIYVAYAGTSFISASSYYNWETSGVFASYSSNGGVSWTNSTVNLGNWSDYDQVYSPAIAVHGSTAYVAYVWLNDSYCFSYACPPLLGGVSSWVATSTNGLTWSSVFAGLSPSPVVFNSYSSFEGYTSSVAILPSGEPVSATSLPGISEFNYLGSNSTASLYAERYHVNISVSYPFTGGRTYLLFVEKNVSAGGQWGVLVDGYARTSNATMINVTNVPLNLGLTLGVVSQASAYRVIHTASLDAPSFLWLSGPRTIDVNYSTEVGIWFSVEPTVVPGVDIDIAYGTGYYLYSYGGNTYPTPGLPWYFPVGVSLTVTTFGQPPITFWNGTGNGSYSGPGSQLNLTVGQPINETGWAGSYGIYNELFKATGLPSTSSYSLTFNGQSYTTPSTHWTNATNVPTGGYAVTNITANSSTAGWEYFGSLLGLSSNVVVVPAQPVVTLTFAYVDVAAPIGTVTFHALGLGPGTVWTLQLNGTSYSSTTPWLNVSTHPGTYPWAVGSAVAANASVGYAPVGTGSSVSVTTSSTVNISYVSAYRVDVVSGLGGTVSGSGNHWLAHGSAASYTAVASNGYTFGGWTGLGVGSYTGGNATANLTVGGAITETASFYPLPNARFNVTFQQTGIPSGAWWTVYLNGVGYSSNATMLTVNNLLSCAAGLSGQYNVSIPYAYDNATGSIRYAAVTPPSSFCTNGGLVKTLTFAPQYQVTVAATSGGTAYLANGNQLSNESVWAAPSDTVQLTAIPAAGWNFGGWNGTGTGSYTGGQLSTALSAGGPVTEFATFVPPVQQKHPLFWEKFVSSVTFPTGTSWSVSLTSSAGTYTFSAVGSTATAINLPPTQYTATVSGALSADGLTKWAPTTAKFSVPVTQNGTTPVEFGKASYWVSIEGSTGGMVGPMSGWQASGTQLTLNATPSLGMQFVGWTGTGPGNYTGNSSSGAVTVQGPITETASFQPVPKAVTTVTTVWQSPSTWAILGLVGLLVGLIVGIAVRRMRAAPAAAPAAWSGPSDGSSGSGGSP